MDLTRKLSWRLLPLVFLGHLLLHLDRQNVGFGALQMNAAIGLSAEMFGFGAGVFFIGYALSEVPSNLMLARFGAPFWMGRIMITWGLVSAAMAMVQGPTSFYMLRFLLGVAEAGFAPGVIYYFSQWYPKSSRAFPIGVWMTGPAVAGVIGGPLATWLMSIDALGMPGWRWMYLIEGIPPLVLGLLFPFLLPKNIASANWLSSAERNWLTSELAAENAEKRHAAQHNFLAALRSPAIWIFTLVFFCNSIGLFSLYFWLPQVLKSGSATLSTFEIGWLTALPYLFAMLGTMGLGRTSDKTGDRRWHLAVLGTIAGLCLLAAGQTSSLMASYTALSVAIFCCWGFLTIFLAAPTAVLAGTAAAGGFAFINAVGNLGGFFGPYMVGALKDRTGSFSAGISVLAGTFFIAALIPIVVPRLFRPVRDVLASEPVEQNAVL